MTFECVNRQVNNLIIWNSCPFLNPSENYFFCSIPINYERFKIMRVRCWFSLEWISSTTTIITIIIIKNIISTVIWILGWANGHINNLQNMRVVFFIHGWDLRVRGKFIVRPPAFYSICTQIPLFLLKENRISLPLCLASRSSSFYFIYLLGGQNLRNFRKFWKSRV